MACAPTQGPYIQGDDWSTYPPQRHKIFLQKTSLVLSQTSTRHCLGFYDLSTLTPFPCPHNATRTVPKPYQCFACYTRTGFSPIFYQKKPQDLSPQHRHYAASRHDVYMALFDHHTYKVGIAHYKRLWHRWTEQGARYATILMSCPNAYEARAQEVNIHTQCNIPQAISLKKKIQSLQHFDAALAQWQAIILKDYIIKTLNYPQPPSQKLYNLTPHYALKTAPHQDLNNSDPTFPLKGEVCGMVGSLLLFHTADNTCVILPLHPQLGGLVFRKI